MIKRRRIVIEARSQDFTMKLTCDPKDVDPDGMAAADALAKRVHEMITEHLVSQSRKRKEAARA